MLTSELDAALDRAAAGLATRGDIDWFVDSNSLISGAAARVLSERANVYSVPGVVAEVRKRPRCRDANRFADRLTLRTPRSYGRPGGAADFVLKCARQLAPSIRVSTRQLMETEGLLRKDAEEKAVNQLASRGHFFECPLKQAVERLLNDKPGRRVREKQLKKPWFSYPAKRRKAGPGYAGTDETLAGVALCNALIAGRATVILSDDGDLAAIMKQFDDNVLWAASEMDCELSYGRADRTAVIDLWERRCADLDGFRRATVARRMVTVEGQSGRAEAAEDPLDPAAGELSVWRSDRSPLVYAHPEKFVTFVRRHRRLAQRLRLVQMGVWMPGLN